MVSSFVVGYVVPDSAGCKKNRHKSYAQGGQAPCYWGFFILTLVNARMYRALPMGGSRV